MGRAFLISCCFLPFILGCRLPPEENALRPFPAPSRPWIYADLVQRARALVNVAVESFYVDRWDELADISRSLDQIGRMLPDALDIPLSRKAALPSHSADLCQQSILLADAAREKDLKRTTTTLGKLHAIIRQIQ